MDEKSSMKSIRETTFKRSQLEELSALSMTRSFQLWYDIEQNSFSVDLPASEGSRWIFDVEEYETPEFIAEITKVVIDSIME